MSSTLCPTCHKAVPPDLLFCPNDGTQVLHATLLHADTGNQHPPSQEVAPKTNPPFVFGPGIKIGEYVVEEKIGEGGMGEVWRGRQPQINKRVAIKLLSSKLSSNRTMVSRFTKEARAVNEIQSRHIVD